MAANGTSFAKAQRNMQGFTTILTSTACEWFLIFLLLIDALFSYLLTKFSRYCKLQLPCILCSRLDHVLGNERPEFYRNLLCSNHRLEISSLISCHMHGKLADGCAMCDDCLMSFSTKNNSNLDMHRLFLGKLGFDLVGCGSQSSLPNGNFIPISKSKRLCSCCNKPWRSRQNVQRLLQLKSPGTGPAKPNIPLPCCLNHRIGMKKIRDKLSGKSIASHPVGKNGSDSLFQIGYGEQKIMSDAESEFPFSDDDDGGSVICHLNEAKDDASKPHDIKCVTPDVSTWHDLAQINWKQPHRKTYSSPLPELISLDDMSPSSNTLEVRGGVSPICQSVNPSAIAESISLLDMNPSLEAVEIPVGEPPEKANVTGTTNTQHVSSNHHEEILKLLCTTAGAGTKNDQVLNSPAPVNPIYEDPSNVCKVALSSKEREVAGFVAEKSIVKEHDRDTQDLKLMPAQISSAQGIDLPMNNTSTSVLGCGDEFQILDASSSNGIQTFQKSILVERTESAGLESLDGSMVSEIEGESTIDRLKRQVEHDRSSNGIQTFQKSVLVERTESAGLESLDGSMVSEIEGESTIDRLKRQVEHDRRCLNALYKELDEERSASAVAVNQAMAMITRLQEEKAALHMDALQYLRMMEEQAEYDLEELEKATSLLAEKEKDIQDLEAELENYRLRHQDESRMETTLEENYDPGKENVNGENMSLDHIKDNANCPCNSMHSEVSKGRNKPDIDTFSWSAYEDEKLYILHFVNSLERKFQMFAREGIVHDMSDGAYSKASADRVHNQGKNLDKEGNSVNCWTGKKVLPLINDLPVSNASVPAQEGLNGSIGEDQVSSKENSLISNGTKDFTHCRENNLVALKNEISDLSDWLEALKDDCNFLEHAFNFLQNGNEGLSFIQEIAHQLQEIRKIGIRSRCRSVP